MNRRDFIFTSALAGAAGAGFLLREHLAALTGSAASSSHELVAAYGDWSLNSTKITDIEPPQPAHLVFVDTKNFSSRHWPVPFRVHTAVQNPLRPEEMILIPKWGTTLIRFNHRTGKILAQEPVREHHRYFGHGVWDPQAEGAWITTNDDRARRGKLTLVDGDLKVKGEIASHGMFPHEVQFVRPGVLLVANSGDYAELLPDSPHSDRLPNLSWVRTRDGGIERREEFGEYLGLAGVSHFAHAADRDEVVTGTMIVNQTSPTVVFRVPAAGRPQRIESEPQDAEAFRGEIVSLAYCRSEQTVVWSHSLAPGVFSYDLARGGRARKLAPFPAKAITADGERIVIGSGGKPALLTWQGGALAIKGVGPRFEAAELKWGSHFSRIVTG